MKIKTLDDFVKELESIIIEDDKWVAKTNYGTTYYWSFGDNKYCVSCCVHLKHNLNSYCFTEIINGMDMVLYMGSIGDKCIEMVKEKWDNEVSVN